MRNREQGSKFFLNFKLAKHNLKCNIKTGTQEDIGAEQTTLEMAIIEAFRPRMNIRTLDCSMTQFCFYAGLRGVSFRIVWKPMVVKTGVKS